MTTCFVIQPFDNGKFDRRYDGIFEPAIKDAGLKPYRVDRDPSTVIVIETIEKNIKDAVVCLADITEDNPNVWYESGYAFASARPVVLVCSEERMKSGKGFPFDIRHRHIITYQTDAPQDFDDLKLKIREKLLAMLEQSEMIESIAGREQLADVEGLSQHELTILALIGNESPDGELAAPLFSVRNASERTGLTQLAFNLAIRGLKGKNFLSKVDVHDDYGNGVYDGLLLSEKAWIWIQENQSKFVLSAKPTKTSIQNNALATMDDEIPF